MTPRVTAILLSLTLAIPALAGNVHAPATQPSPIATLDAYRHLDAGSWIITQGTVRSGDTPTQIKRKITIVTREGSQRAVEEAKWSGDAFVPTGPAQPLAPADQRTFDELGLKPHSVEPDRVVAVGAKRYVCSVKTYRFEEAGRTTLLTLYRDSSGGTKLPPRTISVNNREIPLPADALQADFAVEGPNLSTKGQRRIAALASPLRIKGQTCNCLVEATRVEGTSNGKPMDMLVEEWFCHDLPGERLRTVTAITAGGTHVQTETAVLNFHVAHPAGSAPAANPADIYAAPTSRH
jgi:hypothetical protein